MILRMNNRGMGIGVLILGVVVLVFASPLSNLVSLFAVNIGMASPPEFEGVYIPPEDEHIFKLTAYNYTDEDVVMSVELTDELEPYAEVPDNFKVEKNSSREFGLGFEFIDNDVYEGGIGMVAYRGENADEVSGEVSTPARFLVGDVDEPDEPLDYDVVEDDFSWGNGDDDFGVSEETGDWGFMWLFGLTGIAMIGLGSFLLAKQEGFLN